MSRAPLPPAKPFTTKVVRLELVNGQTLWMDMPDSIHSFLDQIADALTGEVWIEARGKTWVNLRHVVSMEEDWL